MTIAEVSRQYDISADTLRYYERIGLLPHVGRTSGGIRNYSEDDCHWVEYIKCMRSAGVSVETLLEYVTLFHQGASTIQARKNPPSGTAGADCCPNQRAEPSPGKAGLETGRLRGTDAVIRGAFKIKFNRAWKSLIL